MILFRSLLSVALLMAAPVPAFADDAKRGEVVAKVRCMPCHHLYDDSRHIGPSLKGVYGRAPSITGVPFDAWGDHALEAWLANPRAIKPNTKMLIPPMSEQDREDVIAYFRSSRSETSSID